jgi:hypothetical protein
VPSIFSNHSDKKHYFGDKKLSITQPTTIVFTIFCWLKATNIALENGHLVR